MVNNNKILTVSYGTFSCTLEGFDDSFGTMKAIAEYFRDLASDDRYFGAEPPQPDADMLARIAQREVTRRVEAHSENGGIVLRAHDQGAAPAAIAPIAAAVAAPVAAEIVTTEDEVQTSELAPAEAPEVAAEQESAGDTVENNLNNSAEQESATDEAPEMQVEPEFVADVEVADVVSDVESQDEVDVVAEEDDVPAIHDEEIAETPTELEAAEIADEEPEVTAVPLAEQMNSAAPVADNDSIAAKLQRIRAVVSRSGVTVEDNGYQEDEHAVDLVAKSEDSIASAFSVEIDQVAEEERSLAADPEEAIDSLEEGEHNNLFAEDSEDDGQDEDASAANESLVEDEDEDNLVEDSAAALSARLIKVNRDELEAAIAEGEIEEIKDDSAEVDQEPFVLGTSLSVEEEAELQRDLAEVTVSPDEDGDTAESATGDQVDANDHPGAKLLTEAGNTDDDLSRLMAKTNSQMDEPETSQRRDAFSHLRAAVAATKAENILGNDDDKGDSAEAYRDDLASVVKPRRPEQIGARTQRPAEVRPAPLKLVAEQRIDVNGNEARGPVRPRRVASDVMQNGSATIEEDTGGFVEFANNAGATQLPELLEAAASYMAFVEGREQFSRPQLMHKVRQVEVQNFSREDGLRSFGKLLRSGKIEKIRGGRFTVSGEIGFKPDPDDTRAAG